MSPPGSHSSSQMKFIWFNRLYYFSLLYACMMDTHKNVLNQIVEQMCGVSRDPQLISALRPLSRLIEPWGWSENGLTISWLCLLWLSTGYRNIHVAVALQWTDHHALPPNINKSVFRKAIILSLWSLHDCNLWITIKTRPAPFFDNVICCAISLNVGYKLVS